MIGFFLHNQARNYFKKSMRENIDKYLKKNPE